MLRRMRQGEEVIPAEVITKITAEAIEKCIKGIEQDERARSASMAHAHEIWTV